MLQRVELFQSDLTILFFVSLIYILFFRVIGRILKQQFQSVSWVEKNAVKLGVPTHLLARLIGGPVLEELIFRAPLVIIFSELSTISWVVIVISSTVFAAIHLKNPTLFDQQSFEELLKKSKEGELESDHLPTELEKIKESETKPSRREKLATRSVQIIFPFAVGILAGYFGIKQQSLWVPVAIHAAMNLAMPVLRLLLLLLLFGFAYVLIPVWFWIETRWDNFVWKRKWRKRQEDFYRW